MSIPLSLSGYSLTFDDEFNSFTWSPDGSQGWQTTYYFGGRELYSNGDQECFSDASIGVDPFSLQNGALTITASPGTNPDNQPYNSGMITTEGMFSQTYGYFEMRAELAPGQGMWSAFWMLSEDKHWPPEIDALEAFGAKGVQGNGGPGLAYHGTVANDRSLSGGGWADVPGSDMYTTYHTYGVDWEPDFITYYIDGQMVDKVGQWPTPAATNIPMYMIVNLAVGGWPGNAAGETSQMHIDYVRAYSKDPNADAVALQTISSPDGADTTPYGATTSAGVIGHPGLLTLRVSEDALNGDAQFIVTVDGRQIGDVQTVTASHAVGQWQDIALSGVFGDGAHIVDVNFINAGGDGTAANDRHLYVQSLAFNYETIPGTRAENNADLGQGSQYDSTAAVLLADGTATFTTTALHLTLHVSEDAYSGDAKFIAYVDGHQIGDVQTVTASHAAGNWQDITLIGDFDAGPHTIGVRFINDTWGGSSDKDRNLYVQYIDVNGEHILGTSAENVPDAGKGAQHDPDAAVFLNNGTAEFTSTGTPPPILTLHVSEDAWNGNAQFTVEVDGQQLGGVQTVTALHGAGEWQDISLTGTFGQGPHTIDVNFINDGWGGSSSMDRNLYIQSITIMGEQIPGTDAVNNADAGKGDLHDPNAAVMLINGTAEFQSTGTAPPPPSTLVLHVSEDAWNGDAQFKVMIDGQQVGGIQTATTSHAAGQWQDITLTGDFGPMGPDKVDITFLNDASGGTSSTDRNLYVQSIDVNGVNFAGTAATDNADAGKGDLHDPNAAVLLINGTVEFHVNHTAPPDYIM